MDPLERLLAERACERIVVDFVRRLDLGEPASVAELFTEDGIWEWPAPGDGRRSEGRDALRTYFGSRPGEDSDTMPDLSEAVRLLKTSSPAAGARSHR